MSISFYNVNQLFIGVLVRYEKINDDLYVILVFRHSHDDDLSPMTRI